MPHRYDVQLRHAKHYAQVAARAETHYLKGEVQAGLALFDQERPQIDAGWGWAIAHAGELDADLLVRHYTSATAHIGDLRYDIQRERIPQLKAGVAAAGRQNDREAEGVWFSNLGLAYFGLGNPRQAIVHYEQALTIAREIGDRRGEGNALGNLGNVYAAIGDPDKAIAYYEQVLVIVRELGDRRGEENTLVNLGIAFKNLGDLRQAIVHYEQALTIARQLGDRRGEGNALGNLGNAYAALGDPRQAIEYHKLTLAISRELGDRRSEGQDLGNLGNAYADLGDTHRAIEYYETRLVIARETGDRRGEAITSWNLGEEITKQGNLARAVELMQVYVDYLRAIGHSDVEEYATELEQLRPRPIASQNASTENLDEGTTGVVDLRIDAAVPNKTVLNEAFDLAVIVRPPYLPALQEDNLDKRKTGEANVFWPEDQPYVSLRVKVRAPNCIIHDVDNRSFRLYARRASPILYFHLTPHKLGIIDIVVELYQEDDEIGSARVQTVAYEQLVGEVKINIMATPSPQPRTLSHQPAAISNAVDEEVGFKRLLFREKQRRLEKLELQSARKGHDAEPEILNEIEDLKKEIEDLIKQIRVG